MEGESNSGPKRGGSSSAKRRESKHRPPSRNKTNHVIEYEDTTDIDNSSEDEAPPPKPSVRGKGKGKQSQRKRRDSSPLCEEDILEGFCFSSFKTLEDLEVREC